jgi:hypothetical protein
MRASTFEDYLIYHTNGITVHDDEPFLGLEPDGYCGEDSLPEPFVLDWDEDTLPDNE